MKLTEWLEYWSAAHMVNVDQILSVDDMHTARLHCSCMSHGLFWDVTDEEMFAALQRKRNLA
jgi:hypothetical protein